METSVVKFVVFTPESDLGPVQEAVFAAGAGRIGDYGECSYRVMGKGTFKGDADTNPTIGTPGVREEVDEYRLEFVAPTSKIAEVTAALRAAHSYEEPAFEVHNLQSVAGTVGGGRIGNLKTPAPLGELAVSAGTAVNALGVEFVGDREEALSANRNGVRRRREFSRRRADDSTPTRCSSARRVSTIC